MELSVARQLAELAYSLVFGFASGFFYDVLRAFRLVLRGGRLVTLLFDILFWLIELPAAFAFNMTLMYGEMRWHVLIGIALGAAFYFLFPGRLFRQVNRALRRALARVFRRVNADKKKKNK